MIKKPIELIALDKLKTYDGANNYLIYLKNFLSKNKSVTLTNKQAKYIIKNFNTPPIVINNYYSIDISVRSFYKKTYNLTYTPEKIYVNKLLARDGDDLHLWGCFGENCDNYQSIFIVKNQIRKNKVVKFSNKQYDPNPKEHQIEGIEKLLSNDNFILADEMGLGKTITTILAAIEGGFKNILVICPASLKLNWKYEIMKFEPESDISVIDGSGYLNKKWTIINYDIIKNYHFLPVKGLNKEDQIKSTINFYNYDLIILDEAHYLKNISSNRFKLIYDLSRSIPVRWLLTGTPITNKPIDLYGLLKICDSPLANNWVYYVKKYCAGKQFKNKSNKKFWVVDGASNLEELRTFTSDIILRRTKKDSTNLPQKTIKPVYLPVNMCSMYNTYIKEYEEWVEEQLSQGIKPTLTDHLTKLLKTRQLLAQDKVKYTIELIEELIENGKKVIVFSCFSNSIREIYDHFNSKAVIIDGSTPTAKRQEAVNDFQNNEKIKVFCGNIIAAGVGLTLIKSNIVIFNDLDWTPANHAQAEDRSHRLGQTEDVHIIYPLVSETIDITIFNSLRNKIKSINTVMGDEQINNISITEDVINSILNKK